MICAGVGDICTLGTEEAMEGGGVLSQTPHDS